MKNRLLKGLALAATMSFAAGVAIVPAQAASEIVIWADETRGPNLTKVFAKRVTGFQEAQSRSYLFQVTMH